MIRQLLCVTTAVVAAAQTPGPSMSMPALGYIFDSNAKAIRLISGVPGAANLDNIVAAGVSLDSAFVQSRASLAIANTKDGAVVLVRWSATPEVIPLGTSLSRVTQAAFSLAGDQAAISDGSVVEVWSNLAADASKTASFSPDGGVSALAMSATGLVAAGTGNGAIVLFGDQTRAVAGGGQWASLAFLPNGTDLVAADAASQNLTLIRNIQTDASSAVLLSLDQSPSAVAVSADGDMAALSSPGAVTLVNLASGQTNSISCKCGTSRFDRLAGNLVIHLTDSKTGSELLVDADSAQARTMTLFSGNGGAAQ